MADLPHELIEKIEHHNKNMDRLISLLAFRYQQEEAAKTPKFWRPTTWVLQGGLQDSTQLLPYNEQREAFAIINSGASAVLLSDIHIEPGGLATAFGNPTTPGPMHGGPVRLWYLGANTQSSTIDTKAPLWGWCLGTGIYPANAAFLTILETVYEAKVAHSTGLMSHSAEAQRQLKDANQDDAELGLGGLPLYHAPNPLR